MVRAGYKQTEVGVIPEDWEVKSGLEVFIKIQDGTHFSPKINNGNYLYLTSKNIKDGYLSLENICFIDKNQHDLIYKRCNVKYGDILLTKDGANTGNVALNTIKEEFSLLSSVAFLRVSDRNHNKFYLQQILSKAFQKQVQDAMSGNAITRLTLTKIKLLKFYCPSLTEQTAIATALSDIDALITTLTELIDKKRQIKTATMQQLLTGKQRLAGFGEGKGMKSTELGEIPEDWGVKKLQDIFLEPMQNGLFFEVDRKSKGIPLINVGDMYKSAPINLTELELFNATHLEVKTYSVKSGDIFFTRSSIVPSGIAFCNLVEFFSDEQIVFDSHLIKARFNQKLVSPKFVYLACLSRYARSHLEASAKMATMTTIDQQGIKSCPIILPTLEEQQAIAQVLSDMDDDLNALETRLTKTKAIKQGMMQELLTGRTRLITSN